jgi:hypothetical protein
MPIGLKGNTDGSGAVQIGGSDAITISTGLNTTFAGTVTASNGVLYPLTSGTAIASTSGTALDFTGIPSWVKRITVMLNGVSTNGSSLIVLRLGDSGGAETSGYTGSTSTVTSGGTSSTAWSSGATPRNAIDAADTQNGAMTISLIGSNTWAITSVTNQTGNASTSFGAGVKTLSDTLTQVRITTVNGTDTFDAGSINILYE